MENKKLVGSSSSFTNDLFGAKEPSLSSASASAGIFSSILKPPSRVGKNCSNPELIGAVQNQLSGSQARNSEIHGDMIKNKEDETNCISKKERRSIFQEKAEPCPLSSSIYYGGQEDMYIQSSSAQISESYPSISTRKMGDETILVETIHKVLPEGIGGKGHFITSILAQIPKACESIFIVSGIPSALEPSDTDLASEYSFVTGSPNLVFHVDFIPTVRLCDILVPKYINTLKIL